MASHPKLSAPSTGPSDEAHNPQYVLHGSSQASLHQEASPASMKAEEMSGTTIGRNNTCSLQGSALSTVLTVATMGFNTIIAHHGHVPYLLSSKICPVAVPILFNSFIALVQSQMTRLLVEIFMVSPPHWNVGSTLAGILLISILVLRS